MCSPQVRRYSGWNQFLGDIPIGCFPQMSLDSGADIAARRPAMGDERVAAVVREVPEGVEGIRWDATQRVAHRKLIWTLRSVKIRSESATDSPHRCGRAYVAVLTAP